MASRSSRPRHGRSAHPSRDASSDVSSASSVSESDVSVSSSASSLAQQPPVAKHAKRGAGRKSHSTTSVKSAKSSQSKGGPRRSARLATKRKPAGFYARVPKIDHDESSDGKRKRKGSTRRPKKSAPAAGHRRSTGSKKRSSRPRK
ncbi:hypothetical protein AAVH_22362 [Aphelenchoides avenae]|nr:hypothetical protein AAVH_22362 [Aphelenchus avenae]